LSRAAVELGYEIERNGKRWEISGVPRELVEKFSRRTEQVEAAAKSRGVTDPKQKAELAKYTRAGKEEATLSQPEREDAWRSRLTPPERDSLTTLRDASLARAHEQKTSHDAEIKRALEFAEAHCFERKSVVSERELQEAALRAGFGILDPVAVRLE